MKKWYFVALVLLLSPVLDAKESTKKSTVVKKDAAVFKKQNAKDTVVKSDENLLSEIFDAQLEDDIQLELNKTQEDSPHIKENVRKKRLQIIHHAEQGGFPVFNFDKEDLKTTAKTERGTENDVELPPIKKEEKPPGSLDAKPAKPTKSAKLKETPAPDLVPAASTTTLGTTVSPLVVSTSTIDPLLQGESILSHGLPRINPAWLQLNVRHQGTALEDKSADFPPTPYDKYTTPSPSVSSLPPFIQPGYGPTPAPPAYFSTLAPIFPSLVSATPGPILVNPGHNYGVYTTPSSAVSSMQKLEPVTEAPPVHPPPPRSTEKPQVPVFETNDQLVVKNDHLFSETLFPTPEPDIGKVITQFTTPGPFVSSLGENGLTVVTPLPIINGELEETLVVSALPPSNNYVTTPAPYPPYGPQALAPGYGYSPNPLYGPLPAVQHPDPNYGVPDPVYGPPEHVPHIDPYYGVPDPNYGVPDPNYGPPDPLYGPPGPTVPHPEPGYGVPPYVPEQGYGVPAPYPNQGYGVPPPIPDPGYGVPGPVHHPDPHFGVPEPVHHLDPHHGVPEPHYGVPEQTYGIPEQGYGVPEPIHHPDPNYGVPEPVHHHPDQHYGVPEPVHHLDPHHGVPEAHYGVPEQGYGVPEPVHPHDPHHPEAHHFVFDGLPENPHHGTPTPHPAHLTTPVPGHFDPHHPAHVTRPVPGQFDPHHPAHVTTPVPGHFDPHHPAHVTTPVPGQFDPHNPAHVTTPVPGHLDPGHPGHVTTPFPGQFDPHHLAHVTRPVPGHLDPGHLDPGHPAHVSSPVAAHFDLHQGVQVTTPVPGHHPVQLNTPVSVHQEPHHSIFDGHQPAVQPLIPLHPGKKHKLTFCHVVSKCCPISNL